MNDQAWQQFADKCKHREPLKGSAVYLCVMRGWEKLDGKRIRNTKMYGDCEQENCNEYKSQDVVNK